MHAQMCIYAHMFSCLTKYLCAHAHTCTISGILITLKITYCSVKKNKNSTYESICFSHTQFYTSLIVMEIADRYKQNNFEWCLIYTPNFKNKYEHIITVKGTYNLDPSECGYFLTHHSVKICFSFYLSLQLLK